ncbi:glutathione S-transferase family protein [Saccharobesus litoralis]|nr:glutathione S-transferase family protein [Saccharobesus litoralis]
MQLILANRNYSSWSMRAWLAVRKSGLTFTETLLDLSDYPQFKQDIQSYSPTGLVPCLILKGIPIHDSLAIVETIAEMQPNLWPSDPLIRAKARAVSAEMHSGFVNIRREMPMNIRANKTILLSNQCLKEIERIFTLWQQCLLQKSSDQPWLFGRFSIADAMYAPIVTRFLTYGISAQNSQRQVIDEYMRIVMNDVDVKYWCEQARLEVATMAIADDIGQQQVGE